MLSRVLSTTVLISIIAAVLSNRAPMGRGHIFMALLGWGLVYYGGDLAPVIGLEATSTSARYVEPVVRAIGWFFLLVAFGLLAMRVLRYW